MKTIVKTLDAEVVASVERISFELEARRSIIMEMLAQNMDTSTEAFNKYQAETVRYTAMFEEAKREIAKQYVDVVQGSQKWTLDYASCTLTITVDDSAGGSGD